MKGCAVFKRHDGWYFHGLTTTTKGVLIATAPYRRVDVESAFDLGRICLDSMEAVPDSVPHPTDFEALFRPMLDLAGVKSWSQFMRGVPYVDVVASEDKLRVSPTRNAGPRRGYDAAAARPIILPLDASAAQVGEAVQQALNCCE